MNGCPPGARWPPPELLDLDPWSSLIRDFVIRLVRTIHAGQGASSWWRSVEINRACGGAEESQHLLALAFDIVGPRLGDTARMAREQGLTAVLEGDHLHVQRFPAGALARAGVVFPTGARDVRTL